MAKHLLIVESPNKKQKLLQYLDDLYGSGQWYVAASVGHVQDLPEKELGINRERNYSMSYQVSRDKEKVVTGLKNLVREVGADNVILATDPDREGEAISWHLSRLLNISPDKAQRATFQEITKSAIKSALDSRRPINMSLVKAQEARRAIDRIAGYEVSDIARRKTGKNLTAGRVQSVALKLIVEREKTISSFTDQFSFKLTAVFTSPKNEFIKANYVGAGEADSQKMNALPILQAYLNTATGKLWRLLDKQSKPVLRQPGPAFITSSLQQEAIRKLSKGNDRWGAKRVMEVAQALFAAGHITYMRTDSPNLSLEAVEAIQDQVISQFGDTYFQPRRFPVKADAQEAHEAIRPTHMDVRMAGTSGDEQSLYRLIYTRAMASQMKPAQYEETILTIGTGQPIDTFQAKASTLIFEGYRAIYTEADEEEATDGESVISPVAVGTTLRLDQMQGKQTYRQPPKRFEEATLIKSMEQKGIGRPSTYASILSTIQKRGYAETGHVAARKLPATIITLKQGTIRTTTEQQSVGGDKAKLVPTATGIQLADFLEANFSPLVDYGFTAGMEKQLDDIVEGKSKFLTVIQSYDQMHQRMIAHVEAKLPDAKRETVTRLLGEYKNKPVRVGTSKQGTYLLYADAFTGVESLSADKVTLELAIPMLESSSSAPAAKGLTIIHKAGKYEVRKGQFGYYLTDGVTNAKLPKQFATESQMKTIKAADAQTIIKAYLEWKRKATNK